MYFVVEQKKEIDSNLQIVDFQSIDQSEVDDAFALFAFTGSYKTATTMKDIVVNEGIRIQLFFHNLVNKKVTNMEECEKLVTCANGMILNYSTAIKTFIDIEERQIRKFLPDDALKQFKSMQSHLYDNHKEYRLWMKLRNYVVHYGFPYTGFYSSLEKGVTLICSRDNLLNYENWTNVKKDILNLPDNIPLDNYVQPMNGYIYALYIEFVTLFGPQIVSALERYGNFCRKYNVQNPAIIYSESEDEMKQGHMRLHPFPLRVLWEAIDVLKSNPHVKIHISESQ